MTNDLVKLARYHVLQIEEWGPSMEPDADLVEKLADRIEKLEAALRYIERHAGNPTIWYAKIARKALEDK